MGDVYCLLILNVPQRRNFPRQDYHRLFLLLPHALLACQGIGIASVDSYCAHNILVGEVYRLLG